jgi:hypothetical protein
MRLLRLTSPARNHVSRCSLAAASERLTGMWGLTQARRLEERLILDPPRSSLDSRSVGITATAYRLLTFVVLVLAAGCGGGGSTSSSSTSSSGPPSPPSQPGSTGSTVTVTAGQQTTKVNVEVGAATHTLSIIAVGVGNSAGSVGVSLKQGTTTTLLLAGQGLVTGTQYSVSEASPADITVTQPGAGDFCMTTDGTPCVSLTVAVAGAAALGPRNIMVTKSSGELAAFVGGIIVVPGP